VLLLNKLEHSGNVKFIIKIFNINRKLYVQIISGFSIFDNYYSNSFVFVVRPLHHHNIGYLNENGIANGCATQQSRYKNEKIAFFSFISNNKTFTGLFFFKIEITFLICIKF
jgi:hypothetical protein